MGRSNYRNVRRSNPPCNRKKSADEIVEEVKEDMNEKDLRSMERKLKLQNIATMVGLDLKRPHADS